MDAMERRVFLRGASLGLLAFTVGGTTVMMTAGQARAVNVPFRMLKEHEAETLAALGETLVPGARNAGANDCDLSVCRHNIVVVKHLADQRERAQLLSIKIAMLEIGIEDEDSL